MPIGGLFFEISGDTSRLNASLQEAIRIAQDAGVKITRAVQSIISAFDEALNPTKRLAEQVKLLETAGKSSSDIWQVMGERMKTAADAARANSQAVDPLVQKHLDVGNTLEDFVELTKATDKEDKQTISKLILSGRITLIPVGTRIEVIDSHMRFGKIHFQDGTRREGWMLFKEIAPDKPK
jgi:hypothetical protein